MIELNALTYNIEALVMLELLAFNCFVPDKRLTVSRVC